MKRREFITLVGGAAAWPLNVWAEQRRPRIAVLTLVSAKDEGDVTTSFVNGLRNLGYVEGQTVDIDYRYAEGDTTRLKPLADELIALKPNVALADSPSPALALNRAAPDLPIVCPRLSDAVVPGLVASYSRPGGSVTGISQAVEGLPSKQVELALEAVPGAARIGFLANPSGASMSFFAEEVATAARIRGFAVLSHDVRTPDDLAPVFDGFVRQRAQAVIIPQNGLFVTQVTRIVQLALTARLPTIFAFHRDVTAGGLVSYGIDERETSRRAAVYVDRILKGAKPRDLPIEFPTKLTLVINLKTAKALGLTIPPTLLARADEVIE